MQTAYVLTVVSAETIAGWVDDARRMTFALIADLDDDKLLGPQLDIVNPLLWELGHLAWFQERFTLRELLGRESIRSDADSLWDSSAVAHDSRWELPLPSRAETLAYMDEVRELVMDHLLRPGASDELLHMALYTVFHEDMHDEALAYTRQTLGWPPPTTLAEDSVAFSAESAGLQGEGDDDVEIPDAVFELGARRGDGFVFDNEKWAHSVEVAPFRIARHAVTQAEFCEFVDDDGYRQRQYWSEEGWRWRHSAAAEHPAYWRRDDVGRWQRRSFDRWIELEPAVPVFCVNWFEAEAFCRWANRRLPSEAEWELVASGDETSKRRYPWGSEMPTAKRANADLRHEPVPVDALAGGDSKHGVRQLCGNTWEWTSTTFDPYPGFEPDRYRDNSKPFFGSRKVLRGGAFATRSRMLRNTLRNYFPPDRRDVLAGFRTCAI